jgi:hypothetical protein
MFDLLDKIRQRPAMYIGYHSPTHLHSFLSGFSYCGNFKPEKAENPDFRDFHDWVAKRLGYYESTSGWAHMIEDQREDKEEALWLFFELLDEFRGITRETFKSLDYTAKFKITDKTYVGYSRHKKIWGGHAPAPKPRPHRLAIRKMEIEAGWYSLVAFNKKGEILEVMNSESLEIIYKWAQNILGVNEADWK